jgi:amidase
MKAKGATIIDPADVPTASRLAACEIEVLLYEFKANLNTYLASRAPGVAVRSLEELIAFNERERVREMPYFGQELFVKAEGKGPLTAPGYLEALSTCRGLARDRGIDAVMTMHRLDAIVAPTLGPAWVTDLVKGDDFGGASFPSTLAAVAGYPAVTVPAGFVEELPVGISFIGGAWSEERLISIAYAYEQATKHRWPPRFLPTVRLNQSAAR